MDTNIVHRQILQPSSINLDANPASFISIWDTTRTGPYTTSSSTIKLPLESLGTYNFVVDWGDGNSDIITIWNQAEVTHQYQNTGIYTVNITGQIEGWSFYQYGSWGDSLKILEVSQWGNLIFGNSGYNFFQAQNMNITATDAPDLSSTTTLKQAFTGCYNLGTTGDLNSWDVSQITNMDALFSGDAKFNQPLDNWNVSRVTSMSSMFAGARIFNQSIGNWDVSSVTNMGNMFYQATYFNQDISGWNTSSVTNMYEMFREATYFNQPIGSWDVSGVYSMVSMFDTAPFFNQPLNNWNITKVTQMNHMFYFASRFNQPIGNWNVTSVYDMTGMFHEAQHFNQPIGTWDVSNVALMSDMFGYAYSFNQSLSDWNTSTVVTMSSMFFNAQSFNQNLGSWNVSSVTNMNSMLLGTYFSPFNYDQLLIGWSGLKLQNGTQLDVGNAKYTSAAESARQSIIDNYEWVINDGFLTTDLVAPTLDSPADFSLEYGSTQGITWTAGDPSIYRYQVSLDGLFLKSALWSNNGSKTVSIYGLSLGKHNVTIFVFDDSNNVATDTVVVTSEDSTAPTIGTPGDISYYQGSTGNILTWNAYDLLPGVYNVVLDGNMYIPSTHWINGPISVNVDNLPLGSHTVTISVYDTSDNSIQNSVVVQVLLKVAPDLTSSSDISYEEGSTGNEIIWNANDTDPTVYNITVDGNLVVSDTPWVNGSILLNIDGLSLGLHTVVIHVYDTTGNNSMDTVLVTVKDTTSPSLSSPDDVNYSEGSVGNIITWTSNDNHPYTYNITRDGSLIITNSTWSNGSIELIVDGLELGSYTFTLFVSDTSGNVATDTIIAKVVDLTTPELNAPGDISYEFGTTGHSITWMAIDLHPSSFNVTINNAKLYASGNWTSGNIEVSIDGLAVGLYNFGIQVYDTSGNTSFDSVIVTVTQSITTNPPPNNSSTTSSTSEQGNIPLPIIPFMAISLVLLVNLKRRKLK